MYYLYAITPILGLLKNYIKYKKIDFFTFIRTPLLYAIIEWYIRGYQWINVQFIVIVFERWLLFIFKSFRSYLRNDYQRNRLKYEKKYKITY